MNVKDIDKELKSLQKRLERYGKYEGMYLNEKYYQLISEAENIKYRIKSKDEDLTPQRVTGLIRRIKGIQKTKVTEFFNIYDPETDEKYSIKEAPIARFKIEKIPQIFKEKAIDVIEKIKKRYKKPSTEEFVPEPIPPEYEKSYTREVLRWVIKECEEHGRTVWVYLLFTIERYISEYGEDYVAKMFEEHASQYGTSGELIYDEAKEILLTIDTWGWQNVDLETNKNMTDAIDRDNDFGDI